MVFGANAAVSAETCRGQMKRVALAALRSTRRSAFPHARLPACDDLYTPVRFPIIYHFHLARSQVMRNSWPRGLRMDAAATRGPALERLFLRLPSATVAHYNTALSKNGPRSDDRSPTALYADSKPLQRDTQ